MDSRFYGFVFEKNSLLVSQNVLMIFKLCLGMAAGKVRLYCMNVVGFPGVCGVSVCLVVCFFSFHDYFIWL